MRDPYRTLLLLLAPVTGCPLPEDDTGTTGTTGDDTATGTTVSELGCYDIGAATECPDPAEVDRTRVTPETCGAEVVSVDGAGTAGSECPWAGGFAPATICIYPVTVIPPATPCDYGRPLVVQGAARLAPLARRSDWAAAARDAATAAPRPSPSDPARAEAWARVALAEHASVASFARLVLELVALGAPADLVADAQAAGLDEVRHARLAFALAGPDLGPGPLALGPLDLAADLVALAVATARDGCVAETLSALQVAEALAHTEDPAERAALTVLARDEARHAALAWRVLRWAVQEGGAEVVAAVRPVFARPCPEGASALLPPAVATATLARGWAEVVLPSAAALLGGAPASRTAAAPPA